MALYWLRDSTENLMLIYESNLVNISPTKASIPALKSPFLYLILEWSEQFRCFWFIWNERGSMFLLPKVLKDLLQKCGLCIFILWGWLRLPNSLKEVFLKWKISFLIMGKLQLQNGFNGIASGFVVKDWSSSSSPLKFNLNFNQRSLLYFTVIEGSTMAHRH